MDEYAAINEDAPIRWAAGDCEITRTWYGFQCREKNGKVYRIFL